MMNEPKAQKILPNFCCSERRERRMMIKKFCRIFVVRPSFIQASSCYKVYTQAGSLRSPFFMYPLEPSFGCIRLGAHARLPSACAFCTPLYVPPPQARSPRLHVGTAGSDVTT